MLGFGLGLTTAALMGGGDLASIIAALFGPSDVGFWPDGFDPADGRVWQTNAGWPEASAAGQTVGVALDIRRAVERGVERISNGAFATDLSDWAASSGASITRDTTVFPSGAMRVTANGGNNSYATQTISGLTVGARYEISCRAYTPSSNTNLNRATIGTQATSFTVSRSRPQSVTNTISTLTLHFVASGASQIIYCSVVNESMSQWGTSGNYGIFTDVSVREIPGLHATQDTSGDRPLLARRPPGGRRNLLTATENLSAADWVAFPTMGARTATTDPAGGSTAFTLTNNTTNGAVYQSSGLAPVTLGAFEVIAKAGTSSTFRFEETISGNGQYVDFDLSAGTAGSPVTAGSGGTTISAVSIENMGGGWMRCRMNVLRAGVSANFILRIIGAAGTTMTFWRASSQIAPTAGAYQKVTTAYDVTEAGKPDRWSAVNVSSDTLNLTLPAGTYTRAWVTPAGDVTIQTGQVLSGTENVLLARETADVFYINRDLTAGEQAQLTAYWQSRYAA